MPTGEERDRFPIFQERFNSLRGSMSQAEFSQKIGVSRPTVGFYENGERLPDAIVLKKIAEACKVSSDWLLGITDIPAGNADDVALEKMIGISPAAIEALKKLYMYPYSKEAMNYILASEYFDEFVGALIQRVAIDEFISREFERDREFVHWLGVTAHISLDDLRDTPVSNIIRNALKIFEEYSSKPNPAARSMADTHSRLYYSLTAWKRAFEAKQKEGGDDGEH